MRFDGKVVVVAGATSGVGLETARRVGSEGARVVIADLDIGEAGQAAGEVKTSNAPDAWASACDVSSQDQVRSTVDGTVGRFGRLDVVVDNAGSMTFKPIRRRQAARRPAGPFLASGDAALLQRTDVRVDGGRLDHL
jgi:NAD(P)-dependent dehydrogenase (short-subunit alcohol dehydrogenase family)